MLNILLQAGGGIQGFLPIILVLVVMYFFFFRPQLKKQKEEKKFREEGISKGMRIVTTSGIHGKILDVQENVITIESENSRLKIEKSAISKELSAAYNAPAAKEKAASK